MEDMPYENVMLLKERKTIVIAEAGISHMGNSQLANALAESAFHCGADAVKFQLFSHESRPFSDKYRLSTNNWKDIFKRHNRENFKVFFSVFDFESVEEAKFIGAEWIKLSFISKQNSRLIEKVNKTDFKRKIISVDLYNQYNSKELAGWDKLYCPNTGWKASYPTPLDEVDFTKYAIRNMDGEKLGFSCHSTDYRNCLIASSLGAPILEKHFKLGNDDYSPDEKCSLSTEEMKKLVFLVSCNDYKNK